MRRWPQSATSTPCSTRSLRTHGGFCGPRRSNGSASPPTATAYRRTNAPQPHSSPASRPSSARHAPTPPKLAPTTTPWLRAALELRAASDLIATHSDPDGRPRTPDAAATEARVLVAGLVDLGHLATTILAAEEPLALRALQAGVQRTTVKRQLPGLGHLADLARDISAADSAADPGARARLKALSQTWTPIRTDDPVTELGDRMHRLRQATFDMAAEPRDTLATLRDITTIGTAVHAHTAAFHGAQPTTAPDPVTGARGADALVLRGRAWQVLHHELAHFVTLGPPHATVRDDLVALSRLLPALAPLDARASSAAFADSVPRRVGGSLNGAVASMTDIGDHSAVAFAQLARTGVLRLNARDLPRDLVAADPDLAEAKLRSALVAPPTGLTDAVMESFDAVRGHPIRAFASTAITGRAPSHVEREMEGLTLTWPDSGR